ncbi:MAG: ATP-binding cassette domain-containing protein [Rhodobiaceae bacterium]|nr:ATP-binding cassette domain-containing protein [Rhodobiaceae bacterium]
MTHQTECISGATAETDFFPFKAILVAVGIFSFLQAVLQLSAPLFLMQIFDRVLTMRHGETLFVLTLIFTMAAVTFGLLEIVKLKLVGRLGPLLTHAVEVRLQGSTLVKRDEERVRSSAVSLEQAVSSGTLTALLDLLWVPFLLVVIGLLEPALAGALLLLQLGLGAMLVLGAQARTDASTDRSAAQMGTFRLMRFSGQMLLLAFAGWYALSGALGAGALIAFSFLMMRSLAPFEQLMGARDRLRPGISACSALLGFFKTKSAFADMSENESDECLSVRDIYVRSPNGNGLSLANLSFAIAPGEAIAAVGLSGAGKTLLCRVAAGHVSPTSGSVLLSGVPLNGIPLAERRVRILTCGWGGEGVAHDKMQPAGRRALQQLEEDLAQTGDLFILDMPETQLDQPSQMRVVSLLKEIRRGGGSVLMATGSRVFSDAADRVLVLQSGRLVGQEDKGTVAPTLVSSTERKAR